MEQSGGSKELDQNVDGQPEEKLVFNFGWKFALNPLPKVDGDLAWDTMWNTYELRELK